MLTTEPLQVRRAATVVCIRRAPDGHAALPLTRAEAEGTTGGDAGRPPLAVGKEVADLEARDRLVFGVAESVTFTSGWEVLFGQGEVQNWVRSAHGHNEAMRYPGEWKFAGGGLEPGESPEEAALRELQEEFMLELPTDRSAFKLRLLTVAQTRPVRNVSYIMYNFVAAAEENPWLENFVPAAVNAALEKRRVGHASMVENGSFWGLSKAERESVSPEVREVRWMDMRTAVLSTFTSMNSVLTPVNAFQLEEFARLGITRRDPMFITMTLLLEVESCPTLQSLVQHTSGVDAELLLRKAQWLEHGMSPEEVALAWRQADRQANRAFRSAEELATLRAERMPLKGLARDQTTEVA